MYAVVGCTDCGGYWLLEDPETQESATCPTCGRSHQTKKLRRFHTAEDRSEAVQARAQLLADKRDEGDSFAELDHAAVMEQTVEERSSGFDDPDYLERSGLDPKEVADAGDVSSGGSRSRDQIVRDGIDAHDDREAILAYATDHGVPEDAAADLLDKLVRRGDALQSGGRYRLL
jgi:hypothetical protein